MIIFRKIFLGACKNASEKNNQKVQLKNSAHYLIARKEKINCVYRRHEDFWFSVNAKFYLSARF